MEIHKPKPVHGWRELLSEIVVIVMGVSIALAAEQLVETLHWREQVQGAHRSLAADMSDVLGMAAEREGFSSCLDERLNHLADDIDEAYWRDYDVVWLRFEPIELVSALSNALVKARQ